MSEDRPATPAATTPAPAPVPFVGLNEFCAALSSTVRKTILIAAFHAQETAAGRLRDTDAAYVARFDAFRRRPAA